MIKPFLMGMSVLLLGLFFSSESNAQNNPRNNQGLAIYIMPLSIIPSEYPRIRLGGEYFTKNSFSYSLDIGYGSLGIYAIEGKKGALSISKVNDYSSYEIRPEVKWYWVKKDERNSYFALELVYMKTNKSFLNDVYYPLDGDYDFGIRFDAADWTSIKKGVHIKAGGKIIGKNKPFFFETYFGVGIVRHSRLYSNITNPTEFTFYPHAEWGLLGIKEKEKNDIIPHLSFGVKFGYIFWKK